MADVAPPVAFDRLVLKALHFRADSLNKVINGKYRVSASMVVRVAKIAEVGVDDVLAGKYPVPGTCPHCGRGPT
jgi:hypothetical protein